MQHVAPITVQLRNNHVLLFAQEERSVFYTNNTISKWSGSRIPAPLWSGSFCVELRVWPAMNISPTYTTGELAGPDSVFQHASFPALFILGKL